MGRVNTTTLKHNKLVSDSADYAIERERKERIKAVQREAKLESFEFKNEFERRKCIQNLYQFEKAWKKECAAKEPNVEKIENARLALLTAMDKAAADSIGRILAEIKQVHLDSNELITIDVSSDVFYNDFKNFCKNNFSNYLVTEEELNQILKPYITQNLSRIKQLGEQFEYSKPYEQLAENIEVVKKISFKQLEMNL